MATPSVTHEDTIMGQRKVRIGLGVLLLLALAAAVWSYRTDQQHNAALGEVVDRVAALDEGLDYTAVREAHDRATAADAGFADLYDLLSIEVTEGSQPRLAPADVTPFETSLVMSYQVERGSRTSCVISVLRAEGYRVEALPNACGEGELDPGLLDDIGP